MIHCFEYWYGPYPFMKTVINSSKRRTWVWNTKSAVAYGNGFVNGYKGYDLSGTGWGQKWDYIIVHESGHEWFANNVTTKILPICGCMKVLLVIVKRSTYHLPVRR